MIAVGLGWASHPPAFSAFALIIPPILRNSPQDLAEILIDINT
jgi:hypothetical protein